MENSPSSDIEENRKWMRHHIYSQITEIPAPRDLLTHIQVIFSHYGLLLGDIGKEFLSSKDWSDPSIREDHFQEIKKFLERIVR